MSQVILDNDQINSPYCIAAASLLSASGATIFMLLPILLGSAAEYLTLNEEQAGLLASSYFVGFLLVCLSAVFWMHRVNWQYAGITGSLILAGGLMASAMVQDYQALLLLMAVSGVGAGILYGLAMCVLSKTKEMDRNFGIKLLAEVALAALLLLILPVYVSERWGFQGLMLSVAGVAFLVGLAAFWLPVHGRVAIETDEADLNKPQKNWPIWLALVALMIYFAGLSGIWAFVERIGTSSGLQADTIGMCLSFSMLGGALGALCAALWGNKYGRTLPLIVSTLLLLGVIVVYSLPLNVMLFALASFIFAYGWNYGLPYQMGIVVSLDKNGKLAVMMSSFISLGAIMGPAVGGMLIVSEGYAGLYMAMALAIVLGLTLFSVCLTSENGRLTWGSITLK